MEENSNLRDEIVNLNQQLFKMKEKLNNYSLDGVPSIREGFLSFYKYPIYTFVCTKLSVFFLGSDVIFNNFLIPLSASTILGLYFSAYVSSLLLLLSTISNICYKKCKKVENSYETIINYLEKEIEFKTLEYNKLINNKIDLSKEECEIIDINRNLARIQMINSLLKAKKYLENVKNYDYYISSFDVSIEEIQSARRKLSSHKHR